MNFTHLWYQLLWGLLQLRHKPSQMADNMTHVVFLFMPRNELCIEKHNTYWDVFMCFFFIWYYRTHWRNCGATLSSLNISVSMIFIFTKICRYFESVKIWSLKMLWSTMAGSGRQQRKHRATWSAAFNSVQSAAVRLYAKFCLVLIG